MAWGMVKGRVCSCKDEGNTVIGIKNRKGQTEGESAEEEEGEDEGVGKGMFVG